MFTGIGRAGVNAVPRYRSRCAAQLLRQSSANPFAMTHLKKTRDDVNSLEAGRIIHFCVTDDEGANQGEVVEAVQGCRSKSGPEVHAHMELGLTSSQELLQRT